MKYSSSEKSTEELALSAVNNAKLASLYDNLSAGLAKQALDNTAMLAAAEENYRNSVPSAGVELHKITQAYAYQATMRIIGGD